MWPYFTVHMEGHKQQVWLYIYIYICLSQHEEMKAVFDNKIEVHVYTLNIHTEHDSCNPHRYSNYIIVFTHTS